MHRSVQARASGFAEVHRRREGRLWIIVDGPHEVQQSGVLEHGDEHIVVLFEAKQALVRAFGRFFVVDFARPQSWRYFPNDGGQCADERADLRNGKHLTNDDEPVIIEAAGNGSEVHVDGPLANADEGQVQHVIEERLQAVEEKASPHRYQARRCHMSTSPLPRATRSPL